MTSLWKTVAGSNSTFWQNVNHFFDCSSIVEREHDAATVRYEDLECHIGEYIAARENSANLVEMPFSM